MDKEQLKNAVINCILYGGSVILFFVILFAAMSAAHANIPENVVDNRDAKIIRAYGNLLHEIWLDKPSYVEDALMEGDAFIELDELLDGEWGDVFVLRNKKDSIEYHNNWNSEELKHIHSF